MEESRAIRRHVDDVDEAEVEGEEDWERCDILVRSGWANASMVGMVVAAPRRRAEVMAIEDVIFMMMVGLINVFDWFYNLKLERKNENVLYFFSRMHHGDLVLLVILPVGGLIEAMNCLDG